MLAKVTDATALRLDLPVTRMLTGTTRLFEIMICVMSHFFTDLIDYITGYEYDV